VFSRTAAAKFERISRLQLLRSRSNQIHAHSAARVESI
jgi:hypothetical protein